MEGFELTKEFDLDKPVLTLKLLKDKRLAAGNNFGVLNIYDLISYEPDIIIKNEFKEWITNINQLSNEDLIVSSGRIVKIIKIEKNTYNVIQSIKLTGGIFDCGYGSGGIYMICNKIIELSNNDLAICIRYHNLIQLWKKKNGEYYHYDNLIEENKSISEIFEIKKNYLLSDNNHYHHLVIWDTVKKQINTVIKNIRVNYIISDTKTSFLNKKTFAYCGLLYLYIIDKKKFGVIQAIKSQNDLISICLFHKNILFIGDYKGLLYQYEIEGDNIRIKCQNIFENGQICSIMKIDANRLAIGFSKKKLLIIQKK